MQDIRFSFEEIVALQEEIGGYRTFAKCAARVPGVLQQDTAVDRFLEVLERAKNEEIQAALRRGADGQGI